MAPPYDVVDTEEAAAMAEGNPHSFFRISRCEIELPKETDPYSEAVYKKGAENLHKFIQNGWLVQDPVPILYVYMQRLGTTFQFGIMALTSLIEYEKGIIKKHELTREKKEKDRLHVIEHQSSNAEPVFFTYHQVPDIDTIVNEVCLRHPFQDFVAVDGVQHTLWKMTPEESHLVEHLFSTKVKEMYIADGHHRTQASYLLYKKHAEAYEKAGKHVTGNEDFCFVMALLFPSNQVHIWDYNRVLKELNGHTPENLLKELSHSFDVHKMADQKHPKPKAKGHFSFLINKEWYDVAIKADKVNHADPLASLDTELLTKHCLEPIFGIKDIRSDERIDFVGGIRGLHELERRCEKDCKVAIALFPVSVGEVMKVADAGKIMPPKSTWFEPKPRSGGLLRMIDLPK